MEQRHCKLLACFVHIGVAIGIARSREVAGPFLECFFSFLAIFVRRRFVRVVLRLTIFDDDWSWAFSWNWDVFICWVARLFNEPSEETKVQFCIDLCLLTCKLLLLGSHGSTQNTEYLINVMLVQVGEYSTHLSQVGLKELVIAAYLLVLASSV